MALSFATSCAHSQVDSSSRSISCSNTKIYQDYVFATCNQKIVIQNLKDNSQIKTEIGADDLAIADDFLFTIEMNDTLSMYSLSQATNPVHVQSLNDISAKFFTGIDAKDGYIIVSGGLKNPSFLKFDHQGMQKLSWNSKANEYFGRPDVSLFKIDSAFKAVFSLDVSLTYKWGVHVVTFKNDQPVHDQLVQLESGFSPFQLLGYAPTNFPISSAVVGTDIYLSHWKTQEIILISSENENHKSILKTDFTISHMTSDTKFLYFVSKQIPGQFYKLDPATKQLTLIKDKRIQKPFNIAVQSGKWAIADKETGIITGSF